MELVLNNHVKGFHALRSECAKYQTKLLNVSASVERDNRVKFTCALATGNNGVPEVRIGKLSVLANGFIIISYQVKLGQEVEIKFSNVDVLESLRYVIETIRAFNPKNQVRDASIWKLVINMNTIDFDYVEEVKIQLFRMEERATTHMYKGEHIVKSFKPTDTVNLRTATDMAYRGMKFMPR